MKKHLFLGLACLALSLVTFIPRAQAQEESISFQVFYDALAPYGDWINVEGYGYCWHPSVAEDWTPYTDGNWAYTDYGWTWCGNEEWAWAPFHYGRWTQLQNWGWVWVPGYEWAPAWVSWRFGDDYVGWAPLPPTAVWVASVGFNTTVDVEYGIAPSYYSFCPVQYFGAHQLRPYIRPYWNNGDIFHHTKNVTRIARNGNSVFLSSGGPNFAEVNQRVEHPFQQLRLEPQRNVDPRRLISGQGRNIQQNNVLQVVAPQVVNATARPQSVAAEVHRQQVVRPSDRVPPQSQPAPAANVTPVQNVVPPPVNYTTQQEIAPTQPAQQGNVNVQGHLDRPNRPVHPGSSSGSTSSVTPPPQYPGSYQPNTNPAPTSVSGTMTHQLVPKNSGRPNEQARPDPIAAQQQQAAQQQAAQQQAAQQRAARQKAAQQQAAQQQQQAPQRPPQQQYQQPQQLPQQPQQQFVPPGGPNPGGDGHHKGR